MLTATCHKCEGTRHYVKDCHLAPPHESYVSGSGYGGGSNPSTSYSSSNTQSFGESGSQNTQFFTQRQSQQSGTTSGGRTYGNRAGRNNQSPRTQGGCNSGAGHQAHGCANTMTQQEVEQDPRVITGTLLISSK